MKININIRNRYILIGDLFLIFISVLGSYILRLEFIQVFSTYYLSLLWLLMLSLTLKPIIYYFFGLYRKMWIYASIRELKLIILAVSTASAVNAAILLLLFSNRVFTSFPRSVLIIDWIISLIFVGGLRFGLRVIFENNKDRQSNHAFVDVKKNALIIGAGDMGATVAREMQKNPQLKSRPIGFLDDNPEKYKQQLHGVPVIGRLRDLSKVIKNKQINEVIIAIPSASGRAIREITEVCRRYRVPFRTMPGIYELLGGEVSVTRLREVEIADLLRRSPTPTKVGSVGEILRGKVVLVTGAGGSIGSELCRQIARWEPSHLILLGHGENAIFETYQMLRKAFPLVSFITAIADVRDKERVDQVFRRNQPQVVFHAAAHKHVPLMETNIEECALNNVYGSKVIIDACLRHDVSRFVFISTDKAVQPISIMGATKRVAELLVLNAAWKSNRPYCVVRFGNVLGSRGSVVPLFKQQIAQGGPVTVTHPDMKRYFMTIPEAVYLVLQSAAMGSGGETFVLDMGEQIKIVDLARDLIRLSGFEPDKDIEIVFSGIREGEKLSEDLWNEGYNLNPTAHPSISCEKSEASIKADRLTGIVDRIINLSLEGKNSQIIDLINHEIPGADIHQTAGKEQ